MFSWSKKNDSKRKTRKRGASGGGPALNEFGIPVNQQTENDEELEAELRALTGGIISVEEDLELNEEGSDVEAEFERMFGQKKGKKKANKKSACNTILKEEADDNIDIGMGDVNDEDLEGEDVDIDENDPELLGELMDLTGADEEEEEEEGNDDDDEESMGKEPEKKEVTVTSLLTERLNMYKAAEAKAKENKESSRARRFARGIKTLQQLIKKAEAGQPVLPSEIPPVIATNLKPMPLSPPAPAPAPEAQSDQANIPPESHVTPKTEETEPLPVEDMSKMTIDSTPQDPEEGNEKHGGSIVNDEGGENAEEEAVTEPSVPVVENPWLPVLRSRRDEYKASALTAKRNNDLETALKHVKCVKQLNALITAAEQGEEIDENDVPPSLSGPPQRKRVEIATPLRFEAPRDEDGEEEYEIPRTVLEALNQRLRIYTGFRREAERTGNEAGVKKYAKMVQIYEEAIKLHKAGKKIPLQKLPTPRNCPPIPIPFELD